MSNKHKKFLAGFLAATFPIWILPWIVLMLFSTVYLMLYLWIGEKLGVEWGKD